MGRGGARGAARRPAARHRRPTPRWRQPRSPPRPGGGCQIAVRHPVVRCGGMRRNAGNAAPPRSAIRAATRC